MDNADFWNGVTKEDLIRLLREIDRELVGWEGVDITYHMSEFSPVSAAIAKEIVAMNRKEYAA